MAFCPVCLGILPYSWQNTSRDITCEQLHKIPCQLLYNSRQGISFISFLGGAITEVIGGTIFFVYRKSLSQLNYYHKALHEDQRFLSSVNLIKKFHDENMGDEMLKEIIQSAIDINRAEFGHAEEKKTDKNKSDT